MRLPPPKFLIVSYLSSFLLLVCLFSGKVVFGSTVKVRDLEADKNISYQLVGQDEADIKKNLVFFRSPIGKAFIGKDKGEMVKVNTPSGERNFEILDVEYI